MGNHVPAQGRDRNIHLTASNLNYEAGPYLKSSSLMLTFVLKKRGFLILWRSTTVLNKVKQVFLLLETGEVMMRVSGSSSKVTLPLELNVTSLPRKQESRLTFCLK